MSQLLRGVHLRQVHERHPFVSSSVHPGGQLASYGEHEFVFPEPCVPDPGFVPAMPGAKVVISPPLPEPDCPPVPPLPLPAKPGANVVTSPPPGTNGTCVPEPLLEGVVA